MHELSLAQALVEQVTERSKVQAFSKVSQIRLEVGALSGVIADSIRFCFSEAARGTLLEEADLIINEIPLAVRCSPCAAQSSPEIYDIRCGQCGSRDVTVISGRDFKIIDLEVD